jgi:uroporphyrinogen-III synthase
MKAVRVLCTGQLSEALVEHAGQHGVEVTVMPFIHTAPIEDPSLTDVINDVAKQRSTVVFTSLNGVEAVTEKLGDKVPDWKIFSMGGSTRDAIESHFGKDALLDIADNGAALAQAIIAQGEIEELHFFCGDQRRDELPDALDHAGIKVNAIEVYRTTATPQHITEPFDGVLFFSPSAVRSYVSMNGLGPEITVFAIGATTAAEAAQHTSNIVVPEKPGREQVIQAVLHHFATTARTP